MFSLKKFYTDTSFWTTYVDIFHIHEEMGIFHPVNIVIKLVLVSTGEVYQGVSLLQQRFVGKMVQMTIMQKYRFRCI